MFSNTSPSYDELFPEPCYLYKVARPWSLISYILLSTLLFRTARAIETIIRRRDKRYFSLNNEPIIRKASIIDMIVNRTICMINFSCKIYSQSYLPWEYIKRNTLNNEQTRQIRRQSINRGI